MKRDEQRPRLIPAVARLDKPRRPTRLRKVQQNREVQAWLRATADKKGRSVGAMKQHQMEQAEKDTAPPCPRCGVSPHDDGSFYDEDRHSCVTEGECDDPEPDFDDEPDWEREDR